MHTVTSHGFELKIFLFILAYGIEKCNDIGHSLGYFYYVAASNGSGQAHVLPFASDADVIARGDDRRALVSKRLHSVN